MPVYDANGNVIGSDLLPEFNESAALSVAANNTDFLVWTDVSLYKWLNVHVWGTFSGTIQAMFADDTTQPVNSELIQLSNAAFVDTITTPGLFGIQVYARYFKLRTTAWTSGTATGKAEYYNKALPFNINTQNVFGNGGTFDPTPATHTEIAAGHVGNTTIKATAGTYYGLKVTGGVGIGTPQVLDGANAIDALPASAAIGFATNTPTRGIACVTNIIVTGGATNPAMSVYWS
jgi:hypothetical protein